VLGVRLPDQLFKSQLIVHDLVVFPSRQGEGRNAAGIDSHGQLADPVGTVGKVNLEHARGNSVECLHDRHNLTAGVRRDIQPSAAGGLEVSTPFFKNGPIPGSPVKGIGHIPLVDFILGFSIPESDRQGDDHNGNH